MTTKPPAPPRKKNTVPVALVLETSPNCHSQLAGYCSNIIASLQALHPQTQLLITAVTPTSHAIPLNPFLPPAAFLSALPSFIRRPARPTSSIWRAQTGLLRAIKLARKRLLEGTLAGAGGEGKGQLPKYVVVVSATDVENFAGDEAWMEDDEQAETWESMAKSFTRGQHCTTLFSLISLGYTPNLEAFWRESCGRFPPNLVYTSVTPPPSSGFTFPLLSPSHACFLIGFYNNNTGANKRTLPAEATAANKKAKPNPPTLPGASVSPQLAAASLAAKQQPTPPNLARLQTSPQLAQKPNVSVAVPPHVTNENLQQYVNELKATAARNGQPPPSAADLQAVALAAYANTQQQRAAASAAGLAAPGSTGPSAAPLPAARGTPTPRSGGVPLPPALLNANPAQLTQQQVAALPPMPADMRQRIQTHLDSIQQKAATGQLTQEEAQGQIKKLQEFANGARLQLAKQQAQQAAQQAGQGAHNQGLGLNIPLAPGMQPGGGGSQQHARQPSAQPQSTPQPPAPPQRQASSSNANAQDDPRNRPVWRGPLSFAFSDGKGNANAEFTMYCQATPMQQSAIRDLSNIKFPPSFRISSLAQVKMHALQQLAQEHTLPAINLHPIPAAMLPKELKDKQALVAGAKGNDGIYGMFAQMLETRANCGVVRFSGTPNGIILVAVPNQQKILGLVFAKIPLPEQWFKAVDPPTPGMLHQRTSSQQQVPQQQQHVPRPPSAQSGMFSSPVNFNLQLPPQAQQQAPPKSFTPVPPPQPFAPAPQQQQQQQPQQQFANYPQQQPPPPQPAAPAPPVPEGSVGGMDFAELQRLLGPEQFAAIMSGI
ncbi:hypothetical protein JCM10213v2_000728 [Rhodosporidiobolus nylandii]